MKNFEADIWPAKFCLDPLVKKIAVIIPKLFYQKYTKGEIQEMAIVHGLDKKSDDERTKRRDILKLTRKIARKKG